MNYDWNIIASGLVILHSEKILYKLIKVQFGGAKYHHEGIKYVSASDFFTLTVIQTTKSELI